MKTPITYYGGKQRLVKKILPLIPEHTTYIEPFFGGGAIFFAKKPVQMEVINDLNDHAINFYRVLQQDFEALQTLVRATLYSRAQYKYSRHVYLNPGDFSAPERAWAFWLQSNMSFGKNIGSGWGYAKVSKKKSGICIIRNSNLRMILADVWKMSTSRMMMRSR